MSGLIITIGNPLRRDDGVAHVVAERLPRDPRIRVRPVLQLTPEIAAEIEGYDSVVFVDADVTVARLTMAPVNESELCPALTHASTPPEIVELSRSLFGFAGTALLCRIPVDDLTSGEGLSRRAAESAALAISELSRWIEMSVDP
jgi:hydrogenase maturation protease